MSRPSPTESATLYKIGTVKTSNNSCNGVKTET